jgi:N-acyl homoserine lactone hydrolase
VRLIAVPTGSIDADLSDRGGAPRSATYPVMCFLVDTGTDTVLFDTGMHPQVRHDPEGHWGRIARRRLVPRLASGEDVVARLAQVDVQPQDVSLVLNSHLHNDHAGMNLAFPRSTRMVRRREFEHAVKLMDTPSSGFVRGDFYDEAGPPALFDYETTFDVLGDGRLVLISTPGHTPGHQSLVVRFDSGREYVLTGDAVYTCADLEAGEPPHITWDRPLATESAHQLRTMARSGAHVLVSHDAGTWGQLDRVSTIHTEE